MSLVGKARARPDQVKKVLETGCSSRAPLTAYKKAMNRLDSYTPLGYSLAGSWSEVGAGAEEFAVGQVVACAGNEFALHAEINWVPTNLCVAVPDGVDAPAGRLRHRRRHRHAGRASGATSRSATRPASSASAWSGSSSSSCSSPPGSRSSASTW